MLKKIKQLITVAILVLCGFSNSAFADDCIGKAASCIVNAAKAGYYGVSAVGEALEFGIKHPDCVAAIVAQDYVSVATMTTVSGLAASGVIGSSESSCKQDLYGKYAGKIASTLASIVPSQKLKDVASGAIKEGFEDAMSAVPFPATLSTVGLQLTCGCAIADAGADMIDKIKKTAKFTGAAAKACAGFSSCVGKAVWNTLVGAGEVFYQVGECIGGPNDCGENAPLAEASYYQEFWAKELNQYVEAQMSNGGLTVSNGVGYVKAISPEQFISSSWHECESYYLNHRYSGGTLSTGDHAQRACNTMRDKFYAEADAIRNVRIETEIFQPVVMKLATQSLAKYTGVCVMPNQKAASGTNTGINVDSDGGASNYGGIALQSSQQCIKKIKEKIGIVDGNLNTFGDTVTAEVHNTYRNYPLPAKKFFDIEKAFNAALTKYDTSLKSIGEQQQKIIAATFEMNLPTAKLNKAYRDITLNEKWPEYKAKCPAKGEFARDNCLENTANYLGVQLGVRNGPANSDVTQYAYGDSTALEFAQWKNQPIIYQLSLDGYRKAADKGEVSDDLAKATVLLAYGGKQTELNDIAPKSIADAKAALADARQKQEQKYDTALEGYTSDYANAIKQTPKACMSLKERTQYNCKFSEPALTNIFNQWNTGYQKITSKKEVLDKVTNPQLPFPEQVTGKPAPEFGTILFEIAALRATNKNEYKKISDNPDSVIKELKTFSAVPVTSNNNFTKSSALDAVNDKQAQSSAKDGLGRTIEVNSGIEPLSNQAKDIDKNGKIGDSIAFDSKPPAKPSIRGMRAAPGMQSAPIAVGVKPIDLSKGLEPAQLPATGIDTAKAAREIQATKETQSFKTPQVLTPASDAAAGISARGAAQQATQGGKLGEGISAGVENSTGSARNTAKAMVEMPKPTDLSKSLEPAKQVTAGNDIAKAARDAQVAKEAQSLKEAQALRDAQIAAETANKLKDAQAMVLKASQAKALADAAAAAAKPKFDKEAYKNSAAMSLSRTWLNQCKIDECRTQIGVLIDKRIKAVFAKQDSGSDLTNQRKLADIEREMDSIYNPLMQAEVAKIPVTANAPPELKEIKKIMKLIKNPNL